MYDQWTDRLSEYIDGELSAAEAAELQRHLLTCDVCADTHAELLRVIADARQLQDTGPEHDLWGGIAARIGAPALPTTADVLPITRVTQKHAARRFTFSLPQLAAAAVVLMALSGGAVYLVGNRAAETQLTSGTIMQTSSVDEGDNTRLIGTPAATPSFDQDVAELEETLEQQRDRLDPETVAVIERSLESINDAIAGARAALQSDPGNPYLERQLNNTMRKKLDLLRRATRVQRVGT